MHLHDFLSGFLSYVQPSFSFLRQEIGPLTEQHEQLVMVLGMANIEAFVRNLEGLPGRPLKDRQALVRAFVAKSVLNLPTTLALIDRLSVDATLRRLCGWEGAGAVPSESTFSRAFGEFANSGLPSRLHEALVVRTHKDRLVGHISRDSTAIEVREKPEKSALPAATKISRRQRGRPKKGKEAPKKEPKRLDQQLGMTLGQMLADLPTRCNIGAKHNAKGHMTTWIGFKLHIDSADGDIPVSCLLTSASLHDSQAALPLMATTALRVVHCYELMDSAYDAPQIKAKCLENGNVPIIDHRSRRGEKDEVEAEKRARRCAGAPTAEDIRYRERSGAERVNGALKDSFGGRFVRVRGHEKVMCHLMFGVLALTVVQLLRLIA